MTGAPDAASRRQKAAIIGGGVIGGGWVARFLLAGWDVALHDPDPDAGARLDGVLSRARLALPGLSDGAPPAEGTLSRVSSLADAVAGADWVQESVPERLEVKQAVLAAIEAAAPATCLIGSSTSGFRPTQLAEGARHPERILVAHPFVPVYLIPLVEVVTQPGADAVATRAGSILTDLGFRPLRIRQEIDAHLADRFLEAVWREALWLVRDGIATTEEIDEAIRLSFGLRWAQIGLFEGYRIAGGAKGMRHFIGQFGPALDWPWTRLTDVPELTQDLIDKIADQSDAQSGQHSIDELEAARDANLVAILRGLKARNWGAGAHLNARDAATDRLPATLRICDLTRPLPTGDRVVPLDWTDYNGHMTEARYLQVLGDATDRTMALLGCDADYIAAGSSFFTAESHIRHLAEVCAGARLRVDTQLLDGSGKRLQLFHRLWHGDTLIATGEHMLLHVDLATRRASLPGPRVAALRKTLADAHEALPRPEGAGAAVGRR